MLRVGPPLTRSSNRAVILLVENHSTSGYSSLSCLQSLQVMIPSDAYSWFFSQESVEQLSFLQAVNPLRRVILVILISGSASSFSNLTCSFQSREFIVLMHWSSKFGSILLNLPFFAMLMMYSWTIFFICLRVGYNLALENAIWPDFMASAADWLAFSKAALSGSFLEIQMGISLTFLVSVVSAATSLQLTILLTLRQLVLSFTPRKYLLASLIFSTSAERFSFLMFWAYFSWGAKRSSLLLMGSVMLSDLVKKGEEKWKRRERGRGEEGASLVR